MTCHTPFKEGSLKWNFECALFGGKANSLVLSRKNKIPTAFDLQYLKQILDKKAKRKDEGSRRKDRPRSTEEDRTIIKENKIS